MVSPGSGALNPYRSLGLQRNPFIAEDEPGVDPALWIDRGWSVAPPIRAKRFLQVIGVRGAGKTSHLLHWQAQTGGAYCHYPPGLGRCKLPPVGAIAYWDEADRIPPLLFRLALVWASHTHATIVAGTHADLGAIARSTGFTVETLHLPPFDAKTLLAWATRRIQAVQLPDTVASLVLTEEQAAHIVAIAQGSWCEAADHLHIWAAAAAQSASLNRPTA